MVVLHGKNDLAKRIDSHVQYILAPAGERHYVYVPRGYTGSESYGLIVFTDANSGVVSLPKIWQTVLDHRKYIFIAAQNAGNDQSPVPRISPMWFCFGKLVDGIARATDKPDIEVQPKSDSFNGLS